MLCDVGRDLGVCATDDVEAIFALDPDCVVYTPLHFDVGEVQRVLRAGVNIVTSAEFLTGRNTAAPDIRPDNPLRRLRISLGHSCCLGSC
jgi:hypothetical protein